jgi:hypothetical protein
MHSQSPLLPLPDHLSELFESLKTPVDGVLTPGFYERVHGRIQASRPASIWWFTQTRAGSRMAFIFVALTLLITGIAVVSESEAFNDELQADQWHKTTVPVTGSPEEQRDAVLENIAAYARRGE